MPEWEEFKIKKANEVVLDSVNHVAHLESARRIAEDGTVKAGLVYDESKLNQSRLSVSWLSGNTWALGSIYGTVQFEFDWNALIKDKNIYWVEAIRKYKPPAFRFLISEEPISSDLIRSYDPEKHEGPLRFDGKEWIRNGELTSEFMFAENLSLRRHMTGLSFIRHHGTICTLGNPNCEDKARSEYDTGGHLLAWLLANDIHRVDKFLKPEPRNNSLEIAFSGLNSALSGGGFGGALSKSSSCKTAALGALSLHGNNQTERAEALVGLIKSGEDFRSALIEIVREHFNTPEWTPDPF
jgi:hypothetical protein